MQRILQLSAMVLTLFLMPLSRSLAQTYCASNGTAPWEQWIGDLRLTDNQTNGAPVIFQNTSQKEGYGNFTSQIIPLRTGQPYSVVLTPAFSWQGDPRNQNFTWQVWIDYNQNNIFESSERIINAPVVVGSPNIISFDMPTTATLGRTRMRVSMREGAQSQTVDPCATFQRGEVEDYSVNITGGVASGPADLTLANLNIANSPVQPLSFLNCTVDLRNIGGTASGAFNTKVYISEDNIIDANDIETLSIPNLNIAAGASQNATAIQVPVAAFRTDGNYFLILKIDGSNQVTESNENNNIILAPFVVRRNNLVVTNVTGATQVAPGSTVPFAVTIRNDGTIASYPDSVGIVYWQPPGFSTGVFNYPYSPTKIPVPSLAAGQSLVINGNFVMPNRLKTDYLSNRFVREPYFISTSLANIVNFTSPQQAPLGFLYPLQPIAQADLQVSTTQLNASWDSINPNMELRVTLRNNGPQAARNVKINIHRANVVNSSVSFNGTGIDNFVKLTGAGTVTREFTITGSREENGDYYNLWNLDEVPANTTLEATFSCQASGYRGVPQYERDFATPTWYRTLTIRSWVQYADARDDNRANDSSAVLRYPNVLSNPNPTPNNLNVTNVTGATQVASGSTVPFVVTVRNNGTTASVPDSISLVLWRPPFPGGGLYNYPYSPTKIAVPSIAAGQSIVVNGNFVMPSRLRTDILSDNVREPYFISTSAATTANTGAPLSAPLGFSYPLQPLAQADLQVTTTQLNATWDSISPFINLRVTLRNNGPDAIRNVVVNVYKTDIVSSVVGVLRSDLDNFIKLTGVGTLTNEFLSAGVARAELGYFFNLWNIPEIAAGATIEATFRGQVVGYLGVPQSEANTANPIWYRTLQVKSNLQYAEARDDNRANDSSVVLRYPNILSNPNPTPQPDLTVSNLSLTTTPPVSAGSVVNYRFNISNIGTAAATGAFNVKAYISRDNVLSADDIQDGIVPTGNLAVGQIVNNVAGASTIPSSLAAGNYYLILKIDSDNQIAESNENNNVIALATPFAVTNGGAANCLNVFSLEGFNARNCVRNSFTTPSEFGTLYQYTNNIADGFMLSVNVAGTNTRLFMRNGTNVRPSGSRFSNCAADWIYFVAEGGRIRNDARSTNIEVPSLPIRVRTFGNAQNLDSIIVELDSSTTETPISLVSLQKTQRCNPCYATDRTAPVIQNCPASGIVNYNLSSSGTQFTRSLLAELNITSSDNCPIDAIFPIEFMYPNVYFADWRASRTFSLVRYDSAGNKARCNFTVQFSNPPCAFFTSPPVIANCPANISLQAAAGQTCATATWTTPTATSTSGLIPISSITSNFQSGTCFPIGTTVVTYTVTDSCGRTSTCNFNVVVTGGGGGSTCTNNLLQNAGFESGLNSWDGNGVVTTTANTGTRAARICNSGDVIYQQLTAVGGRVYQLSQMSVRVDAATNGLIGIKFMNSSFTPILDVAAIGINQNQSNYTQLFNTPFSITAPASAAYVQVYVTKSNGTGCIYVDDVCFSQNTGGGGNPCQTTAAPVISGCPTNISIPATTGQICANATWTAPTATGLRVSLTSNFQSGACFPIGITTVNYTATDSCGRMATCSFTVTVTNNTGGGADLGLSIAPNPTTYRPYSTNVVSVTARNNSTTPMTNVRIEFPFPANTVNGGSAVASFGTWNEWCAGGRQCFEWTIPTLAANSSATLAVPLFILNPTGNIIVTTRLLASTPTDGNAANNTASATITPVASAAQNIASAEHFLSPTQAVPVVLQKLFPNPVEADLVVDLESIEKRDVQFFIYDVAGKQVETYTQAIEKGKNRIVFDIFHLPQGTYYLKSNAGSGLASAMRFVKF